MTEEYRKKINFDELEPIINLIKETSLYTEILSAFQGKEQIHKALTKAGMPEKSLKIEAMRFITICLMARNIVEISETLNIDAHKPLQDDVSFLVKALHQYLNERKKDV